jgi:hypothetical protein
MCRLRAAGGSRKTGGPCRIAILQILRAIESVIVAIREPRPQRSEIEKKA